MAQKGFDILREATDSRYRLSMVVGRRAAQLKLGVPSTLTHKVVPKGDNAVSASIVGRLTIPLYEGGQTYSQIRQAKETVGQRRLDAEDTRDQVRSAIFNRKISAAADAYLAELRADAVIRKP